MDLSEHKARRERLAERLASLKLDAFLVSAPPNITYLTGFTGSNALLFFSAAGEVLVTDPRYETQAPQQTGCKVRVAKGPLEKAVVSLIRRRKLKKIGFERERLSFASFEALRENLAPRARLCPVSGLVEKLRAVKSPAEITLVRKSVATCSKAFARAVRRIRPGVRERDLAAEIDHQMRKLGAERPAFDTIVASGARSACPHAEPTDKTIDNNELVLIDMGAQQQGYASDMTRMLHLGAPPRRVRHLYKAVLEAQLAGVDAVRAGISASAVDRRAREVLRKHGLAERFSHSTGHGLGLEIHEEPRIGRTGRAHLEKGMVITVEPGVYIEGFGGIRIEDTVLVTEDGCEVLTPTSKELLVI